MLGCTVAFLSLIISMITGNATGTTTNNPILMVFFKKLKYTSLLSVITSWEQKLLAAAARPLSRFLAVNTWIAGQD